MQLNKWPQQGTSRASQVRSLRKVNNDQLAISIDDADQDDNDKLEDDDDDKGNICHFCAHSLVLLLPI